MPNETLNTIICYLKHKRQHRNSRSNYRQTHNFHKTPPHPSALFVLLLQQSRFLHVLVRELTPSQQESHVNASCSTPALRLPLANSRQNSHQFRHQCSYSSLVALKRKTLCLENPIKVFQRTSKLAFLFRRTKSIRIHLYTCVRSFSSFERTISSNLCAPAVAALIAIVILSRNSQPRSSLMIVFGRPNGRFKYDTT